MQVRALKTFAGRMGLVRTGVILTVDERYGRQLINNRLATKHVPEQNGPGKAGEPGPDSNTDLGGAPFTKVDDDRGNDEGSDGDGSDDPEGETSSERSQDDGTRGSSEEGRQIAGRGRQSLSLRQAPPSRKKTSTTSKTKRS